MQSIAGKRLPPVRSHEHLDDDIVHTTRNRGEYVIDWSQVRILPEEQKEKSEPKGSDFLVCRNDYSFSLCFECGAECVENDENIYTLLQKSAGDWRNITKESDQHCKR